jgi:hypothetical protein
MVKPHAIGTRESSNARAPSEPTKFQATPRLAHSAMAERGRGSCVRNRGDGQFVGSCSRFS